MKGETAPVDVASYNKEVKENEKFEFSITAAQGYETERVTLEADGTQLVKNAEGFYEIPAVTKAENILVTYKEIPQESAANTGSTEESEEEPEGENRQKNPLRKTQTNWKCLYLIIQVPVLVLPQQSMQKKVYCQKELPWNWHLYPMLRLQQQ